MSDSPRSTGKKLAASAAVLASVGAFVSVGVFSAFSKTQTNSSTLKSAAFDLAQVPSTNLLGTIEKLLPGDIITRCMKLTNASDVAATVAADPDMADASTGTLNSQLHITLQEVAPMTTPTDATQCANAASAGAGYVIGTATTPLSGTGLDALPNVSLGDWAANEVHYYRAVIALPGTVTDSVYAGKTVNGSLDFTATQKTGLAGAR